jgi:lipopolysaccharide biosynthesis glycosyltransferase
MQSARPKLHIVSNSDEKFFPGLQVALSSAVAAASGEFDYHFIVLNGGMDPASLARLAQIIAKIGERKGIQVKLESITIDEALLSPFPARRGSRMTYVKLILPQILPHLDEIIYLDADVLCFSGIEMVRPPQGGHDFLLAGARDFFGEIRQDCPWLDQVPARERRFPYINCGIQWLNLQGLREAAFTEKAIALLDSCDAPRYGDQTIFNFLCRGKIHLLTASINHRPAIGTASRLCEGNLDLNLHYIGSPKPWLGAPTTSNWLAHRLWQQAQAALFPEAPKPTTAPPGDLAAFRRKARLYYWFNPLRGIHYRKCLRSLQDPGSLIKLGSKHWSASLH